MEQDLASLGNKDYNWDRFNSDWYKEHNYYKLREDDRQILEILREHFGAESRRNLRGIDVGSGANLYPAMAMLPFCDRITMYEYAATNREWLEGQKHERDQTWDAFWEVLSRHPEYERVGTEWDRHLDRLEVVGGDVLKLAPAEGYDLATMFFVAESISEEFSEFATALRLFVQALKPGGRFAAGFIKESVGYRVDDRKYPAVSIVKEQVAQQFELCGVRVDIREIDLINPFREGYGGMIVATGVVD